MGAHIDNDALLYISPGTGYWGIPFRIGASPEVTLVTLHGASEAAAHVHKARVAVAS
jgi:predicted MPP superfamily phosphohydrolase